MKTKTKPIIIATNGPVPKIMIEQLGGGTRELWETQKEVIFHIARTLTRNRKITEYNLVCRAYLVSLIWS